MSNSKFKIGDNIRPTASLRKSYKEFYKRFPLDGTVVDILGDGKRKFPIIENKDGTRLTVNPDVYELAVAK